MHFLDCIIAYNQDVNDDFADISEIENDINFIFVSEDWIRKKCKEYVNSFESVELIRS